MNIRKSLLAVALLSASLPAAAQTFNNTIFFGDSLTDSGTFQLALAQNPAVGPSGAALIGKFTTNPYLVWSEQLARRYGVVLKPSNVGGSNYAVGGARAGVDSAGPVGPQPAVRTQVGAYLAAHGGKADPNALYSVWAGGNDMLGVMAGLPAQTTIAAAVTSQVQTVGALQAAGARYILVPTLPDLGLTPAARAAGAVGMAGATQGAQAYNAGLYGGLTGNGISFIPVDTFGLLREVSANAAAFGYTNVTGMACTNAQSLTCLPANYAAPNAPETYMFADSVHPTGKTHTIMADLAYSMIEGPRMVQLAGYSLSNSGAMRADRVYGAASTPAADGTRWWADIRGTMQDYDDGDVYDGAGAGLLLGGTFGSGGLSFGPFIGFTKQSNDAGNDMGSFDQTESTLGGFVRWTGGPVWATAQASYSKVSSDIDREVKLGPVTRVHSGSHDGNALALGAQVGLNFSHGNIEHGPFIGALKQKIELDGYVESDPTLSTALSFNDRTVDRTTARAGWRAQFNHGNLKPYASISWNRDLKDPLEQTSATALSTNVTYSVPAVNFDRTFGVVNAGVKTALLGHDADVGISATVSQSDALQAMVYASFGF